MAADYHPHVFVSRDILLRTVKTQKDLIYASFKMQFEHVGTVRIPDPKETFYNLKNKKPDCEKCGGNLVFEARNSALRASCRKCGDAVLQVPIKRVTTYAEALETAKKAYEAATTAVLEAKFDHLFNYTDRADIEKEKAAYIRAKQDYHELWQSYKLVTRFPELDPAQYDPGRFKRESVTLPITEGSKVRCKNITDLETRVWALKYKVLDPRSPISHILPYTLRDLEIPK